MQEKLTPEDSGLLTSDALYMIFDSGLRTLRGAANDVAHGRSIPKDYMSIDVLTKGLEGMDADLFSNIYQFAYKQTPEL